MGWQHVALEDIAKIVGGSTPRRDNAAFWNGDIPWLTPTDLPPLGSGVTNIADTASHITKDGFRSSSLTLLPPATVVFSSRATIGKVGVTEVPITTNQGFVNLIPSDGVDPRYLAWALFHHADQIAALSGSTTFKEVSRTSVKKFRIPLPPLEEQRRIAHLLDEADRLQRLRKEANQKAQRILPALFVEMFGDPETNPMGWEVTTMGDKTAVRMMGGGTPSKSRPEYWGGDIPWLSSKDIKSLFLDDAADHITEAGVVGSAASLVPEKSTVMVMRSGILAHTAPVAMLTRSMTVNQDQKVLVANPTSVLPEFLFGALLCMRPRILASVRSGATVHNIELNAIRRLPLLVPPLEEQKRFAHAVEAVRTLYALQGRVTKNTDASYEALRSRLFAEAS